MGDLFHNPYHFVPLPEKASGPQRTALSDDRRDLPDQVTHECFVKNTFSGRIRCRLTTITPLVIGAEQTGEAPKQVHPYEVTGTTDPGIPASALRGLISSIIEAATQSAFRVLADRIFSYRKGMTEGLSALGLVVSSKDGLKLFPLADPHTESTNQNQFDLRNALPKNSGNYATIFADELRKVYFGTLRSIREQGFLDVYSTNTIPTGGPFYALPMDAIRAKIKSRMIGRRTLYFNLGDMTDAEPEAWDENKHDENSHIRGILRVLGVSSPGRQKGMPTKKHEFFIPLNKQEEQLLRDGTATVFPILAEALERFNQLADERTKEADARTAEQDVLPYTPHGQTPGESDVKRPKRAYNLKPGDVVFFRPTADGKAVAEVSLSSIWRGRVEKGAEGSKSAATLADFIAKADPDLLPMGDPRKTHLTPAELLFGFVEHKGKRALAGRLRFSVAKPLPKQGVLLHTDWINLQVLNSPKPPSPNFYFHQRPDQRWISKSSLALAKDQIQGRKFYLHTEGLHTKDAKKAKSPDDPRWTMHPDNAASGNYDRMRVQVRPVLADKLFEFEVRFDNLNSFELGALVHALRPTQDFYHKLGLGKPLGLGTVRLDPLLIERVKRYQRYAEDPLDKPRVHASWQRDPDSGAWSGPSEEATDGPAKWVEAFLAALKQFDPEQKALKALLTIGDPSKVQYPVHYPQVSGLEPGAAAFESDRYEWFVTNDHKDTPDADRQHIGRVGDTLPYIKRLPKTERGDGGRGRPSGGGARPRGGAPQAGNRPQNQTGGGGWQGPVNCVCTGQGQRGDWKFEFRDASGVHWGFLDRNASAPPDLRPGQRNLRMSYTTNAPGRYFFKPA